MDKFQWWKSVLNENHRIANRLNEGVIDALSSLWGHIEQHWSLFTSEYDKAKQMRPDDIKSKIDAFGVAIDLNPAQLVDQALLGESLQEGVIGDVRDWFTKRLSKWGRGDVIGISLLFAVYAALSVLCFIVFKTPLSEWNPLVRRLIIGPANDLIVTLGSPEQVQALQTLVKVGATFAWSVVTGAAGVVASMFPSGAKRFW